MFVFSAAYPRPSFEHIHSYINKNTTIENKKSFILSNQHPEQTKEKKMNTRNKSSTHGMYKKKVLISFFLDSVSYHIVHMIWWKEKKTNNME